jgi:hypothetical protein
MASSSEASMSDPIIDQLQNDLATVAVHVREGFTEMRAGFAEMRAGFTEMRAGFAAVNRRLDDLTDISHRIYHEHGQRLREFEDHLTRNPRP